jgi:hypothetical protein
MAELAAMPRLEAAAAAGSQIMASRDVTEGHPAVPAGQGRQVPPWLLVAALLGAGGGGGGIAAAIGSLGGGDVDTTARERLEQQAERIDAQDKAIETVRRDQVGQYRWVASEVSKQSRALAKIAERVGADVDVAVEPYQSGGM